MGGFTLSATDWLHDPAKAVAVAALFGLLIGSFINLVIDRLPVMMQRQWDAEAAAPHELPDPRPERFDLIAPPSHCPHCQSRIAVRDLIPVLSWLALRGRCRHCSEPIGRRTPLVELGLALLYGLSAWQFGASLSALAAMTLLAILLAAAVIDLETRLLPDVLTLPLLWLGLLFNLGQLFSRIESAVWGAVAGYLSLWLVNQIYRLLKGRDGMGQGDFKLLAALGAWFGWPAIPVILMVASSAGAIFGLLTSLRDRERLAQPIAFGPWLALAALPVLFDLLPAVSP
jgi:leader peptidase (prepilin peptidase)/N-methyltransferase